MGIVTDGKVVVTGIEDIAAGLGAVGTVNGIGKRYVPYVFAFDRG